MLKLSTILTASLLLKCASADASGNAIGRSCPFYAYGEHSLFCRVSEVIARRLADPEELLEEAIAVYLQNITASAEEYERVDAVLADTVLEGDSCDELTERGER